jgi:hypothetical protein
MRAGERVVTGWRKRSRGRAWTSSKWRRVDLVERGEEPFELLAAGGVGGGVDAEPNTSSHR